MITAASIGLIAAAGRQSAPPLTLPLTNIIAAYDARSGVTNVSGLCSALADQSGNGYHATQANVAWRPTITTAGGYPSLYVDGTQYLNASLVSPASPHTLYAVIDPIGVSIAARMFAGGPASGQGVGAWSGVHQANEGGTWRSTGVPYTTGRQRLSYDMQTGAMTFRKNGVAAAPTAWTTDSSFTGFFRIGVAGNVVWAYVGHILAVFLYAAPHNQDVEDYIQQEWGV